MWPFPACWNDVRPERGFEATGATSCFPAKLEPGLEECRAFARFKSMVQLCGYASADEAEAVSIILLMK